MFRNVSGFTILVLAIIALVIMITRPVPEGEARRRPGNTEELKALQERHVRLTTELKNRRLIKAFRKKIPNVSTSYLEKKLRISPDPEFVNLSINAINVEIQNIIDIADSNYIVYGEDDTKDVFIDPDMFPVTSTGISEDGILLPEIEDVADASRSVVAIVPDTHITYSEDTGKWTLHTTPLTAVLSGSFPLCAFDQYINEESVEVMGTGFLVAEDVIATAGHVVSTSVTTQTDFLSSVSFVFGYVKDEEGTRTVFSPDEVYKGVEVLAAVNSNQSDWALIKLDRVVFEGSILDVRSTGMIDDGTDLYMAGHPHGLPMKYSDNAEVLVNTSCYRFTASLDTRPFHSGSPVINVTTGIVEGILATDVGDIEPYCGCYVPDVYDPADGTAGAGVTRTTEFAGYLENPEIVTIRSEVEAGAVYVDWNEYLIGSEEETVPFSETGVWLLQAAGCPLEQYEPLPGETWKIVDGPVDGSQVLEKECFP